MSSKQGTVPSHYLRTEGSDSFVYLKAYLCDESCRAGTSGMFLGSNLPTYLKKVQKDAQKKA